MNDQKKPQDPDREKDLGLTQSFSWNEFAFEPPREFQGDPSVTLLVDGPVAFGDYVLLEEVGRGGMGAVYRARQKCLDRIVALKMILPDRLAKPEVVQRFRTEARIAASAAAGIHHPGLLPIFDFGEVAGVQYFTMPFVGGKTLADVLSEGPLEPVVAVRIAIRIADALAHAHDHDVAHLDLKPANVLLDDRDEPIVTDFGLALRLDDRERSECRPPVSAAAGTPSYMAPEQVRGDVEEIGCRTDVHGLGALLLEMLSGSTPFPGDTYRETFQAILEDPPPALQSRSTELPPPLASICRRAMAKAPQERFESIGAMSEALRQAISPAEEGFVLQGRSSPSHERLDALTLPPQRQRSPTPVALAMCVGFGLGAVSSLAWTIAADARQEEVETTDDADAMADDEPTACQGDPAIRRRRLC